MEGMTYLCSPYTHPDVSVRLRRFHRVCREAAKLMQRGEAVFCPIAHSHPIDGCFDSMQGFDFWMRMDIPILRHAARVKVLMLDGWRESRGIAQEVYVAGVCYIPVFYIEDDEATLETVSEHAARMAGCGDDE